MAMYSGFRVPDVIFTHMNLAWLSLRAMCISGRSSSLNKTATPDPLFLPSDLATCLHADSHMLTPIDILKLWVRSYQGLDAFLSRK